MTDIEKLLTEAGFKPSAPHSAKWTRPNKFDWVGADEIWLIPYDRRTHTLATTTLYLHDGDLTPILIALQGKVALTEEERQVVESACSTLGRDAAGAWPADISETYHRQAQVLKGLVTRSTTDVVSLADVEGAVKAIKSPIGGPAYCDGYDSAMRNVLHVLKNLSAKQQQEGDTTS